MRPIFLDGVTADQLRELDQLYQTTDDARVRIPALMVLLAAERRMVAVEVASLLRQHEATVRRGMARYRAEGIAGLGDAPRCGLEHGLPTIWLANGLAHERPACYGVDVRLPWGGVGRSIRDHKS